MSTRGVPVVLRLVCVLLCSLAACATQTAELPRTPRELFWRITNVSGQADIDTLQMSPWRTDSFFASPGFATRQECDEALGPLATWAKGWAQFDIPGVCITTVTFSPEAKAVTMLIHRPQDRRVYSIQWFCHLESL